MTSGGHPVRQARGRAPEIPEDVSASQLDREARAELRTLPPDLADTVARRLVAAELEDDPERAHAHAGEARALASRVGVVREVCGVTAYRAGHWAQALSELRAARRMTGRDEYLPVMADCERALGRHDRALEIAHSPEAARLSRAGQIEMRIVESGVRRDQGQPGAAVVILQVPELTGGRQYPWSARLCYAYADALLEAGRADEAREAFARAAAADEAGETDAAERLAELEGFIVDDLAPPDLAPAGEEAVGDGERGNGRAARAR